MQRPSRDSEDIRAPAVVAVLALVVIIAGAAEAASLVHEAVPRIAVAPAVILSPGADPSPACRVQGAPMHFWVVLPSRSADDAVREAFWAAGVPPGSSVRTYWDSQPGEALGRATRDAGALGGSPVVAPDPPTVGWASGLVGAC